MSNSKKSILYLLFTIIFTFTVSVSGFAKDEKSSKTEAENNVSEILDESIDSDGNQFEDTNDKSDKNSDEESKEESEESADKEILSSAEEDADSEDKTDVESNEDKEDKEWKAPSLKEEHLPYIDGQYAAFRPDEYLTRAEFCAMVYNLYELEDNGLSREFSDITKDEWYAEAVSALVASGMINGYPDGTFRPDNPMTRAEFVTVVCKPYNTDSTDKVYDDTKDHWAVSQISFASIKGWLSGYSDNTFRPDLFITRAESVVIFNRILERTASNSLDMLLSNNVCPFSDVSTQAWYYADIMEATVSHTPSGEESGEIWESFEYKTHGFGNGVVTLNNIGYYIDANGQFCSFTPWSFVTVDGKTYYTTASGNIDITLWGTVNIGGSMYYFQPDYSILQNGNYNQLYFDGTGKYTCGDPELDALVDNALAACTNDSMTFSEKLRAAYLYLRDNCRYLSRAHHPRGTTAFVHESATFMFKNMRGNCYCFAACFLLMARRLGCEDAYVVSGGVGTNNSNHAWVMINSRIYDPELEYAYRYRYAVKKYYDLYNMERYQTPFVYHFPY